MHKSQVVSKTVSDYRFLISLLVMSVMVCAVFAGQPDMFWPQIEHQRATQTAISLSGDEVSLHGLFNSTTGAPVRVRGGFEFGHRLKHVPAEAGISDPQQNSDELK